MIKSFKEFIKESYIESPANADILNNDKKKMKKNGYIEVVVDIPVEGVNKGDKVLVSATEYGELDSDSVVTCYKDDDTFIIPKRNLQIESK